MRPISRKRQRRDRVYPERRQQVYDRNGGRCEAMCSPRCNGQCEQVHHVGGRGGGDPHRLDNLMGCCRFCHDWIETNRSQAYEMGLLARRNGVQA